MIYVNKIENRTIFRTKTGYFLELLTIFLKHLNYLKALKKDKWR